MHRSIIASLSALALVRAQQVGTNTAETHPSLSVSKCSKSGGCTSATQSIVLDANWRWLHSTSSLTNCYTGNTWDTALCPDAATCAKNCALEGADYPGTYGITASGSSVKLNYVTTGSSGNANVGSRVYLMADASHYQMFNLLNQEFTFDVDMSQLPCGVNGALYFSQMDADGGAARFPTNTAGAKYGTGYCDSQCPQDMKFIDGLANSANWNSSTTSPNVGHGQWGTCCDEMDIWEANSNAAAYTPHPCSTTEQTLCTTASGNCSSTCDQAGCDFNSWRMGDQTFLGPGLTVDTKSKFTVVTQFITDTGTSSGTLTEIKRYYVQNGKTIPNSYSTFPTLTSYNSITDDFCAAQKTEFDDSNVFSQKGGLAKMGKAFQTGMVLVMSIWDDTAAQCLWLDSDYPTTADPSSPGINRGPCPTTSGDPKTTEQQYPNAYVTFSNIKYGDLNSTFTNTGSTGGTSPGSGSTTTTKPVSSTKTTTSKPVSSTPPATGGGTVPQWGQCGGIGYTGATKCVSPYTCHVSNSYYSQCY